MKVKDKKEQGERIKIELLGERGGTAPPGVDFADDGAKIVGSEEFGRVFRR